MKKIISIITLLFCLQTNAATAFYATPSTTSRANPQQENSHIYYLKALTKTDFRNGGESSLLKTYTITDPGTYTLVQDVASSVRSGLQSSDTTGGYCSIYINADDVTIDLGGKTLSHSIADSDRNMAIDIGDSKRNITIKNGNISNFSDVGINVRQSCSNIRIQDVTITSCNIGINLDGEAISTPAKNVTIDNCIVQGSTGITGSASGIGILSKFAENITIQNSLCQGNSSDVGGVGVYISTCTNVICKNVESHNNSGYSGFGFFVTTASGDATQKNRSLSFIDCIANGNFGNDAVVNGLGIGFLFEYADAIVVKNCTANNNFGFTSGAGFLLNTTCNYCSFENCTALSNVGGYTGAATPGSAIGFWVSLTCRGNTFKKCIAIGNVYGIAGTGGTTTSKAAGFYTTNTATQTKIENCISMANGNLAYLPDSKGIQIAGATASHSLLQDNQIYNNLSNTANAAIGLAALTTGHLSLVKNNFAFGNVDNSSNNNNYSVSYATGSIAKSPTTTPSGLSSLTDICTFENVDINPS